MEKILTEELLKQIKLINYDRGKTILENNKVIVSEQSTWSKTEEGKSTIKFLTDLGHDRFILQNAKSANNAYNLAAVSAMRKLTEKLVTINYSQTDPFFRVTVLNKKPSGGVQKFSSFDFNMIEKLKSNIDNAEKQYNVNLDTFTRSEIGTNRTISGTFILEDFYFNYGQILNTVKDLNSSDNYLFPDGVYNFFTQFFGGDNVNTIKNSIELQNVTNRPKLNPGEGWKQISFTSRVTNETQWKPIIESLHIILPAASFVLNVFGGPPGMVVGAGLETIDAALYQFYDEDPYMAGLSLIFALVPLGELAQIPGFKQVTKEGVEEGLEKLLWKQVRKEPLNESEELFLKNVTNNPKLLQEFNTAVVNASLRKVLVSNPKGYTDVLTWMVQKGILSYEKYSTIINLIFSTAAYDYWAYKNLGKCSASFKFSDLLQLLPKTEGISASNLIRQIELQPFTNTKETCERIIQIKLLKEKEKLIKEYQKSFQKMAQGVIPALIKNKDIMSTSLSSSFQFEVGLIQSILYQCGFTKKDVLIKVKGGKFIFNDAKRVKKVIISNVTGKIFETITNTDKNTFYSKPLKDGVYILLIYTNNSDKPISKKFTIIKQFSESYNFTSESEKLNWGYYDEKTKKSVEDFQKYFNLEVDGVVGPSTLLKMLDLVKNQKCGLLKNHSGVELTSDTEDLINDEIIKKYSESIKDIKPPKFDENNISPEQQKKIDEIINRNLKIKNFTEFEEVSNKIESEL